jgi:predicted metal-dependent hydrolase
MVCGKLRKAECQVSPNCDWVVSKGCKSKVPRVPNKNNNNKNNNKNNNNKNNNNNNNNAEPTGDEFRLSSRIEELSTIIAERTEDIYEKTDGARNIKITVPYFRLTDEVDYLIGKDLQMIMTGKVKYIQVAYSHGNNNGIIIININKKYITDEDNDMSKFLSPKNTNVLVHNGESYFIKINTKAVTFLKKQLSWIQEEFEGTRNKQQGTSSNNISLPNIEKVKQAYKNLFKKNPSNMGIHRMLHDIVNLLQLNNNSWRVLFN